MGSGLWKLNVSVLEERDYFRLISDFWSGWRHRMPAFVLSQIGGRWVNRALKG